MNKHTFRLLRLDDINMYMYICVNYIFSSHFYISKILRIEETINDFTKTVTVVKLVNVFHARISQKTCLIYTSIRSIVSIDKDTKWKAIL